MGYSSLLTLLHLLFVSSSLCFAGEAPKLPDYPDNLINKVCSHSDDYNFCLGTLWSIPKAEKADANGLSEIAIELSLSEAKNVSDLISSLSNKTKDPSAVAKYQNCVDIYSGINDKIIQIQKALFFKNMTAYDEMAIDVIDMPENCNSAWDGAPVPQLRKANEKAVKVVSMIAAAGQQVQ